VTEFFWRDELTDATIRDELDRRHPGRAFATTYLTPRPKI
jgi:hypothetical protein